MGDDFLNEDYDKYDDLVAVKKKTSVRRIRQAPSGASADSDFEYDNSGLHRAKRALSEARDTLHGISKSSREASYYEDSSALKQSSRRSEASSKAAKGQDDSAFQYYYKAVITPKEENWSRALPARQQREQSTAYNEMSKLTEALLDEYSPKNFPDFEFGVADSRKQVHKPLSSTWNYYSRPGYKELMDKRVEGKNYSYNDLEDSSNLAVQSARRDVASAKKFQEEHQQQLQNNAYSGRTAADDYFDSYYGNRESSLPLDFDQDSRIGKKAQKYAKGLGLESTYAGKKNLPAKFAHYWIPKYYEKTPMLGGWLQPETSQYRWRY